MDHPMKTAIIGLGNIGSRIAANLVAAGEPVIVSERNLAKAAQFAAGLGEKAEAMPIDNALKNGDIIILAIMFDAMKEFVPLHRAELAGKIVVDPSNPVAPDGNGGFRKTIPAGQSSGEIIAGLLPADAKLVKAFGTLGARSLGSGANRTPERAVLFYATDYPDAGRMVARLITRSGFAAVDVGGIEQSIRIEAFGDLSEYGKLGRLVSEAEARAWI
jgi:8-hydroxy-5-deazaflavin:NADPH oxidoreductase